MPLSKLRKLNPSAIGKCMQWPAFGYWKMKKWRLFLTPLCLGQGLSSHLTVPLSWLTRSPARFIYQAILIKKARFSSKLLDEDTKQLNEYEPEFVRNLKGLAENEYEFQLSNKRLAEAEYAIQFSETPPRQKRVLDCRTLDRWLHRLAEFIPWNRFLGPTNI